MKAIKKLVTLFDPIPPEHRALAPAFEAEAQAYCWERIYVPMGTMGALSMILFGGMDWLLYPQHLVPLLILRLLGLVMPYLIVAFVARYGRRRIHPYLLGMGLQCVVTLTDCALLFVVGDWTSPYWLLLLVAVIYVNTPPWSAVWALGNALKYGGTPPRVELGYTTLEARDSKPDPASGIQLPASSLQFWVQDNGPGLTEEQQSGLFPQFNRLHQVRVEGHGLGLSIVQRIIVKLGGEVGVESVVGQGNRFWFTLPRDR
ncbi:MAG: sensor histidine kinase [Anaerolineae bacterium]|nr:sensor histidine kinase [Anaerolineae bacterium]